MNKYSLFYQILCLFLLFFNVLTHGDAKNYDSDFYSKSDIIINNNQHHNHKNDTNQHDHDICCTHAHHYASTHTNDKIIFTVVKQNTYYLEQKNIFPYLLISPPHRPPQYFSS